MLLVKLETIDGVQLQIGLILKQYKFECILTPYQLQGSPPFLFEIDPLVASRKPIAIPFAPGISPSASIFAVTVDGKYLISCGHWDNSEV